MASTRRSDNRDSEHQPTHSPEERSREQERDLEGLSGMGPRTQRRDNRDDPSDTYAAWIRSHPSRDASSRDNDGYAEREESSEGHPLENKGG
jgi:hypothetical protein